MMKKILAIATLIILAACVEETTLVKDIDDSSLEEKTFGDYDFATVNEVNINLSFTDVKGGAFAGIKIRLVSPNSDEIIYQGFTDINGSLIGKVNFPTYLDEVILDANYVGIPDRFSVPILNGSVKLNYAGKLDPNQVVLHSDPKARLSNPNARMSAGPKITYAAQYNSEGLPANLDPEVQYISSALLQNINSTLPEFQAVPALHPSFVAEGVKTTLEVTETAEVSFTFVHDGAGLTNSIGYYTYPTDTPPQKLSDIEEVIVLFPNFSGLGSGGSLVLGHKINLGRFEAGTSIGIVLYATGWDGNKVAGQDFGFFTDKKLNPEPNDLLKQHNILLWDAENELFLVGFEDVRRDDIPFKCDQDFKDAVLFVQSIPAKAISTVNVSRLGNSTSFDRDGDGIKDALDEYPDDKDKAYDSYYPSANGFGSFAFEDNWPEKGDFDFNDLVVDYRFKYIMNATNEVIEVQSKFSFRALGEGYSNSFGFEMDVNPSALESVTGSKLGSSMITTNENGTEAGQSKSVLIVTDNIKGLFGSNNFVNILPSGMKMESKEVNLTIKLKSPTKLTNLGVAPYNPFLILAQDRSIETHLPGYSPTDLADRGYFGTGNDNSDINIGRYYLAKTSLPWAIHTYEMFDYPYENVDIRSGFNKFNAWALSRGSTFKDWYLPIDGYRNSNNIYK
jgi:LruC domain-containing protein